LGEDRKVDKFLPAKDTLFEYIIFKANDIKELIVDEPINEDPAIVTQIPTSSSNSNEYPGVFGGNVQSNGLSAEQQNTLNGIPSASASNLSNQTGERLKSRGSTPSSAHSPVSELSSKQQKSDSSKNQSRNLNNFQSNARNNNNNNNNNFQRRGRENNHMNSYQSNQRYDNKNNNQNRSYNQNNNLNRRTYQNNYNQRGYQQYQQGGYRRNDNRNLTQNNRNINNNNNRNQPLNNRIGNRGKFNPMNKKFDATLKTEFDFEKANEAFQQMVDKLDDLNISLNGEKSEKSVDEKDEIKTDVEKTDKNEDEGNFYDKTKSFFDNISCEAIERTKGNANKFDWKQERKLNAETFGLKITYRRNFNGGFHHNGYRRPFVNNNNGRSYQTRRYNIQNNNAQRTAPKQNSST